MPTDYLEDCDVRWETPSTNSAGSMPLGNGDIGLNLRAEPNGDLLLDLSKTDAWDENGKLVGIGRLRMSIQPNPFRAGLPFLQRLHLRAGEITVRAGELKGGVDIRVWVDANRPVIQIEIESAKPIDVRASLDASPPTPDTRFPPEDGQIFWCHRNTSSIWPETMRLQRLEEWAAGDIDPLIYRTFGVAVEGDGISPINEATLRTSSPRTKVGLSVHPFTVRAVDVEDWKRALRRQIEQTNRTPIVDAHAAHRAWWNEFWDRSRIVVTGNAAAEAVTRAYAMHRFVSACSGRGSYPIWSDEYRFQNTRFFYWPMLAAGDFEMVLPLFKMYLDALPMALLRTRSYFGHPGAFFPERMEFWGAYRNSDYGTGRTGKAVGEIGDPSIRFYFSSALELLVLMLEHELYVFTEEFAKSTLLPLADAILTFYDRHYLRVNGKLRFEPAASLETWHEAVNPLPEIAGLRTVLDGLLRLPQELLGTERHAVLDRLKAEMPPLPMRRGADYTSAGYLIPAVQYDDMQSDQNPELYAVFPYRIYGVGKPDLAVGRRTFARRECKGTGAGHPDAIQAALLGLADEAKAAVVQSRGGAAILALQYMLLQCDGERILVLPAWPKGWDVEWKLHAPMRTVVEGVVRGGELKRLTITPEVREKDVVLAR